MRFTAFYRIFTAAILATAASLAFAADGYRVVHTYPHDAQAYTQGLLYEDGYLYESTGLNGRSSLRMVDLETGRILQRADVPDNYFAEGLASWGSTLIQLTWQSHVALSTTVSASACCTPFLTKEKAGDSRRMGKT